MPILPRALLLALAVRSLSLLLPHTFFQPDEFYQAFEPAYARVFGRGYLTWEWRDLPRTGGLDSGGEGWRGWWDAVVAHGRLRGWIWPGVFVLVYAGVERMGLEETAFMTLAPRLVGIVVAALTDYYTYRLATKVLGKGYASGALFLSLTSLFHAHLLPRALSTSPETLLTTMALCYYPVPAFAPDPTPVAQAEQKSDKGAVANTEPAASETSTASNGDTNSDLLKGGTFGQMDRVHPLEHEAPPPDNMVVAAALAALSICIRPTMVVFWAYLHLERTVAVATRGVPAVLAFTGKTLLGGMTVVALSTLLDYYMVGRLTFPVLTFFHQNVVLNISSFYGATGLTYHLVQSLPILLFPLWYWWGLGFFSALSPSPSLDTPAPLRLLARTIVFTIAALSLSPHSEWRFVHPLLPPLLLFPLPALQRRYTVAGMFSTPFLTSVRQYTRLPKGAFYLALLAPLAPYLYLNTLHGAAQVRVTTALRAGDYGPVEAVATLMPCHSTPWTSHLGATPGWFITCEPPLAADPGYVTEQDAFYAAPVEYVAHTFPRRLGRAETDMGSLPSHVILFGDLLDASDDHADATKPEPAQPAELAQLEPKTDTDPNTPTAPTASTVRDALAARGYAEVANLWNGFDVAQDEPKRRGGVRVWRRVGADVDTDV